MLHVETGWEKAETRFKTWTYTLLHEIIQCQLATPIIYQLLLFIEAVQFFWFAIHPNFSFLWDVNISTWIRTAVRYFQFDFILNQNNDSVFVIILYIVFIIQVIMVLLFLATAFQLARSKKKSSTITTYSLKVLSSYMLLLSTVFALPIFNVYLASLMCFDEDSIHTGLTCYQGIYFLHLVVGIIGFIIHFVMMILATSFYIDLNPWSNVPFAAPQSRINLIKVLMKIGLCLYIILDYKKSGTKEFIAVYGVIWVGLHILRYRQTPHYNRSIFRTTIGLESLILWSCIISNVHAFVDMGPVDSIGLFFLFFGMPFFAYAVITIIERRKVIYRRLLIKNFQKDNDVEMYINVIFNLIQNRDKPQSRMALEGLLKYHVKHCNKKENECACYPLSRDFSKDEEAPEKLWYTWIKHLISDALDRIPKSTRLHMLYAYVQREKLHNKFKALYEMMITEENKPNMEEEFSIFSYKNVIEEEMIENDARNSESKGVDVNVLVDFQNKFVDFQNAVENDVDLHLEFWRELLENNPDIQKLQSLGAKITHSNEQTSNEFKKLNDINPNHIKMLQIYGNYLKDIVNDEVEGQRTLEKAEYVDKSSAVNKQFIDNDHLKYGENSSTCILTISGNLGSLGTIKNVNNEITRILQFSKPDLIGQNISRIIPKVIGDLHDGFMRNYFETSDPKVIGHERLVFPLNKDGYIVPCSLMIKVLPNLDEGIRLVGFLKDVDKDGTFAKGGDMETDEKVHHIMYSGDTGAIHGITHSCKREFGIPASLVSGAGATNDFTMDIIFPDLASHTLEDLKNPAGVVTTLDTSTLQQNYLLGDSASNESGYDEGEEEEEKEKRFKKTNVRVVLAEDTDYQDTNIKVLKLVEVYDEGEFKREVSVRVDGEKQIEKEVSQRVDDDAKEHLDPNRSAEYERSDKDSSVSGGDQANDDIKQLKDFKALISEKTVPKSIKLLSRAILFILLILFVLAILILIFRVNQTSDFSDGIEAIGEAYDRTNLMAQINYDTDKLYILARGWVPNPQDASLKTPDAYLRAELITLIDSLSSVQFDIMRATEVLQSKGASTVDSDTFRIEHQVQNDVTSEPRIYTDSVFQYITAASSIRNSSLTSIVSNVATDSTPKNYFFVRRNGFGPLRVGSQEESDNFYNYYIDRAGSYDNTFRAIMIVALVVLVISDLILIPIVFQVHKTNDRVLSFFGFIPITEISELAAKCEQYMLNYIEDHKEHKDYSYGSEEEIENSRTQNVDNSYLEQSQAQDDEEANEGDSINPETSMNQDVSERIEVAPVDLKFGANRQATLNIPGSSNRKGANGKSALEMSMGASKSPSVQSPENSKMPLGGRGNMSKMEDGRKPTVKEEDRRKEEAEIEEVALDRSTKLLNSRNNRRASVVIQFVILACIFGLYFLLDYVVVEIGFRNNIKKTLTHLKRTSERMPYIRYLNAFTQAYVSQDGNKTAVYGYTNLEGATPLGDKYDFRAIYKTLIQTNAQDISDPSNLEFPGSFDSYLGSFNAYYNGDLCAAYYKAKDPSSYDACKGVSNSLLTKGMALSVTTLTLNSDDVIKSFQNLKDTSAGTPIATTLTSTKFTEADRIMKYIMPPLADLKTSYEAAFQDYLDSQKKIEIIKFVLFIIFCFFVFFFLWQPYLKNLKDKIFRTKGMLNMIPMDIISKNESLKGQFLGDNIMRAVK